MTTTARVSARATPGVHLVVRPTKKGLDVVSASRVLSVPRILLHRPRLDEDKARMVRAPVAELVLAALATDGRVLGSYGWPARSLAYFDLPMGEVRGGLRGRPHAVGMLPRILRVPLGDDADFLFFYGVRVIPGVEGERMARLARRPLSLYYCGPSPQIPRRAPTLPIRGKVALQPLPWQTTARRPRKGRDRRR
jgi:hypothetical protein